MLLPFSLAFCLARSSPSWGLTEGQACLACRGPPAWLQVGREAGQEPPGDYWACLAGWIAHHLDAAASVWQEGGWQQCPGLHGAARICTYLKIPQENPFRTGLHRTPQDKEEEEGKSLVSSPSLDSHGVVRAVKGLRSPAAREPV